MSTERQSFGLNSFLPTGYQAKAEAFAKCLQDKLRSLGSSDEVSSNGRGDDPPTVYGRFTEEEIADNVFLQGPLSYKRRSIPERNDKVQNGTSRNMYFGSLIDKRGMSSDSEDSDNEEEVVAATVHKRVVELQKENGNKRLVSINSIDSSSSWCSCEEGPDPEEDEEVVDALAQQVRGKGSPPIHNPRLRNFRRKGKEEKGRREKPVQPPPQADAELFFDFDVECFSPVNVEEEAELFEGFEKAQLRLTEDNSYELGGTRNSEFLSEPRTATPPPSPANGKIDTPYDNVLCESEVNEETKQEVILSEVHHVQEISKIEYEPDASVIESSGSQQSENECPQPDSDYHFYKSIYTKDSGISSHEESCDETSSRTGDEETSELLEIAEGEIKLQENDEEANERMENGTDIQEELFPAEENTTTKEEVVVEYPECNPEDYIEKKKEPSSTVMVMCEGVLIDESYLPSPRMKLRRCSSLKTWKTPPGTPGRKKIVRFADALGLDLADVRTFLDEIPKIPNYAFEDLHYDLPAPAPPPPAERTLIPMFQQPGTQIDFLQRVRNNNVSLESAILTDVSLLSISGIVRVRNISFHKTVHVRYSKDMWATFADLQATFVPNSSDGFCDNFSFTLYGHTLNIGDKLEFAIRYECGAGQFWDSNSGQNYSFQCMPRNNMPLFPPLGSSPVDTPWTKFY